jgi:predicted 3-demethylubiquinone-9 3-methyltransferase (glyoxalase superfamily)
MKHALHHLQLPAKHDRRADSLAGVFKDSNLGTISRYTIETPGDKPLGSVMTASFTVNGQRFLALNGGKMFMNKFNEAVSLFVECESQEEIDYYYGNLSAVPEAEQCGCVPEAVNSARVSAVEGHSLSCEQYFRAL